MQAMNELVDAAENSTVVNDPGPAIISESMSKALSRGQETAKAQMGKLVRDATAMVAGHSYDRPAVVGDEVLVGDRMCRVRKITGRDYILRPVR